MGIHSFKSWKESIDESLSSARTKFLKPGLIDKGTFDDLRSIDPTPTNKYLDRIIEFYLSDRPNESQLRDAITKFHELLSKNQIKKKDINSYGNWKEFLQEIETAQKTYRAKQDVKSKKSDATVVYRDDRYLVVIPKTHEASCKYGAGTKWCTTAEDSNDYDSYIERRATLYYIIDTKESPINSLYKIAVIVYPNGVIECVDARDNDIEFDDVLFFTGLDASLFVPEV